MFILGELKREEEENEDFERVRQVEKRLKFTRPFCLSVGETFETIDSVSAHYLACYLR